MSAIAATPKRVESHTQQLRREVESLTALLRAERARVEGLQQLTRSLYDHIELLQASLDFAERTMASSAGPVVRFLRLLGLG